MSRHSTRRDNSAYTLSADWKGQVSLHPSSPLSTGAPLRVRWPAASLSVYGSCSAADRMTLQRTVNTGAKIIGAPLPSILDIFLARCSSKTNSIVKDPTHPSHNLFQLLPSGRRYRSIRARSARLLNSFFPQAARALNSNLPVPLWNHEHLRPLPPNSLKLLTIFLSAILSVLHTGEGAIQTTRSNTLIPLYVH